MVRDAKVKRPAKTSRWWALALGLRINTLSTRQPIQGTPDRLTGQFLALKPSEVTQSKLTITESEFMYLGSLRLLIPAEARLFVAVSIERYLWCAD
jgi:hypothetical protein